MRSSRQKLTTIGFDADDTLWHNERYFRAAEDDFVEWLSAFAERDSVRTRLMEIAVGNISPLGFGMKTFTLSMLEAAIEISAGQADAALLGRILATGKEMLNHPVELLPGVADTLENLVGHYRLIMITKGDLLHQENKVRESGLAGMFEAIEIVTSKTAATYEKAFSRHGDGPDSCMMVGNSLKSDIIPALQVGSWGVYVPHDLTWVYEHEEPPLHEVRYRQIKALDELNGLIAAL